MKNKLRTIRKQHRQTQAELAEAVGISRQTIINIEYHNQMPSLGTLKKIEQYYGETVFEF